MRRFNRFGLIAVIAIAATAVPAFAGGVTVGRFYTELAKAKHLGAVDAVSAEAGLRAAGYELPQLMLNKGLTEGDVATISNVMGLSVTTTRPTSAVSESQMNQFFSSFASELAPTSSGSQTTRSQGGDPGNSGNGKGKKKGHNKSTSEPI